MKVAKEQTTLLINTFNNENAIEFVLQEKALSIASAINGTPINLLEKIDFKKTVTYLIFLLKRINDLINVKHKLNDLQIATLASDLMDFCQNETLEDIVVMLKMARKGQLGEKIYKLDSLTIFQEWIPFYLDLKYEEKERVLEREKSEREKEEMLKSQKKWTKEQNDAFRQVYVNLLTKDKKDALPPKEDYLQNSTNFEVIFKSELKEISVKELKKLKKQYKLRQSHKLYLELVKQELKSRVKQPLKGN